MNEDEAASGIVCQFCGGEEHLTFMLLPTGNGDKMVIACATCAEGVYGVKRQLDENLQHYRERQQRLEEHSHLYGLMATLALAGGATVTWGVGAGFLALGGALVGLCVLRAIES